MAGSEDGAILRSIMRPRADDSPRRRGRKAQALPMVIPQLLHLGPYPQGGRQDQRLARSPKGVLSDPRRPAARKKQVEQWWWY
ncbi:hypothetical protein GW17_00007945 [Ensete ventricosum]|nr:hypothetical protein GW17_00007945 [Ensete ventricosum]